MKASELIQKLQDTIKQHGDLPIEGGYLSDDRGPTSVIVLNKDGCDFNHYGGKAVGLFLE